MSEQQINALYPHGRAILTTTYKKVTRNNVLNIIANCFGGILQNENECIYLDNYRKGITPILSREKKVRPEINNKVNVNRASEIVSFKVGYLLDEQVQYIARGTDDKKKVELIQQLNDYMYLCNKEASDRDLAEKMSVCGTAYRLVLPAEDRDNTTPFEIFDLPTAETFVIYYSGIGNKPVLAGVKIRVQDTSDPNNAVPYDKVCCYSDTHYYEIDTRTPYTIIESKRHSLGMIPIIEYPNNASRIGDFELVLPLLDALNVLRSNQLDGVEQFIQSLTKFINVDISAEDFEKLKDLGAIKVKSDGEKQADVQFMTQELKQTDVEVLANSIYRDILTICGMPNQMGSNMSTSDNTGATLVRQGWYGADSRAKATEVLFKKSEKEILKISLMAFNTYREEKLTLEDIDIKLPRRNYENVQQKATVLTTMLGCDKIEPKLAFESCGLFTDPDVAYLLSKSYYEKYLEIQKEMTNDGTN